LNTISRTLERKVHPSYLISGDNAQNDDTKTQYADVTTTGISLKLWPWKKKKTGRRKTKNGPDGFLVRILYQGKEIADLLNAVCDNTLTTRSRSKLSKTRTASLLD
jgi:hypothetical protein